LVNGSDKIGGGGEARAAEQQLLSPLRKIPLEKEKEKKV
jgi:hypothetical protein